jgi:hypothetical protein
MELSAVKGVNELQATKFPSLKRRGGCAAGADGVVSLSKMYLK